VWEQFLSQRTNPGCGVGGASPRIPALTGQTGCQLIFLNKPVLFKQEKEFSRKAGMSLQ
jgi:hypothetical protein